jgi:hypothetical protein
MTFPISEAISIVEFVTHDAEGARVRRRELRRGPQPRNPHVPAGRRGHVETPPRIPQARRSARGIRFGGRKGRTDCENRADPERPALGGASTPDVRCVSPFPLDRQARLARSSGWPRLGAMATVRCPDQVRGRGRGRRRVIGGSHGPFSTDPPNRIIDAGSRRLGENPAVRCAARRATWPGARRDVARWLQRRSTAGRGAPGSADPRNAGG